MSDKKNVGHQGIDGSTTKIKGESQQSQQKGALGVSKNNLPKHKKDFSNDGPNENTTKKQSNSI